LKKILKGLQYSPKQGIPIIARCCWNWNFKRSN
jgi:hypothetical protein